MINKTKNRGDTLIEVLFATAVFSLVAVGALSIMNQGSATSQRALEITLVRQEMDAQAETLRFLNSSYVAAFRQGVNSYPDIPADEWHFIQNKAALNASASPLSTCTPPQNSFILNTHSAKFVQTMPGQANTFSQVNYVYSPNPAPGNYVFSSAEGIWIEAIDSATSVDPNEIHAGYIDFNIRACWISPGQSQPVTLGTIVRLYEPR